MLAFLDSVENLFDKLGNDKESFSDTKLNNNWFIFCNKYAKNQNFKIYINNPIFEKKNIINSNNMTPAFNWDGNNMFMDEYSKTIKTQIEDTMHEISHHIVCCHKPGYNKRIKYPEYGLGPGPGTNNYSIASKCIFIKNHNDRMKEEIEVCILAGYLANYFKFNPIYMWEFTNLRTPNNIATKSMNRYPYHDKTEENAFNKLKKLGLITETNGKIKIDINEILHRR